jgi:hypothetical protein
MHNGMSIASVELKIQLWSAGRHGDVERLTSSVVSSESRSLSITSLISSASRITGGAVDDWMSVHCPRGADATSRWRVTVARGLDWQEIPS